MTSLAESHNPATCMRCVFWSHVLELNRSGSIDLFALRFAYERMTGHSVQAVAVAEAIADCRDGAA